MHYNNREYVANCEINVHLQVKLNVPVCRGDFFSLYQFNVHTMYIRVIPPSQERLILRTP